MMLISNDDDVNSESFSQPPVQIMTLKHQRKPEGRQKRHLLVSGGREGFMATSISLKSLQSIFGFVNSHMMEPSQRFHGNRTFGECCSSVGKAKVEW